MCVHLQYRVKTEGKGRWMSQVEIKWSSISFLLLPQPSSMPFFYRPGFLHLVIFSCMLNMASLGKEWSGVKSHLFTVAHYNISIWIFFALVLFQNVMHCLMLRATNKLHFDMSKIHSSTENRNIFKLERRDQHQSGKWNSGVGDIHYINFDI